MNRKSFSQYLMVLFTLFASIVIGAETSEDELLNTYQETINKPGAVTFTPPDGWLFTDPKILPKSVTMMVIGKGKHPYPPSINLAVENYTGTLKDYLKIVKKINQAQGSEWKELGTIDTELGPGSLSQVNTTTEWGKVKMMHTILPYHDKIYVITVSALQEEFPTFYDTFFTAMRSFHANPQTKGEGI